MKMEKKVKFLNKKQKIFKMSHESHNFFSLILGIFCDSYFDVIYKVFELSYAFFRKNSLISPKKYKYWFCYWFLLMLLLKTWDLIFLKYGKKSDLIKFNDLYDGKIVYILPTNIIQLYV